jgi:Lrp/AsnC family leucine-responsive transcriptional regulator
MKLDDIDLKILAMLQEDARIANVEIARRLKMAPSGILERIRKLKQKGVIKDFSAQLDAKALDMGLLAYVFLKTSTGKTKWDVGAMMAEIPEVLEVHDIAGDDCYIVKIRTRDTDSLYQLLRDKLGNIGSIISSRTTIVLRTVKETTKIPLEINHPLPRSKKKASQERKEIK